MRCATPIPRGGAGLALAVGLALAAPEARAAPACDAFYEAELIGMVLNAQSAADRGNQDTLRGVVAGIKAQLPCLMGAPPPRLVADYFVLLAVLEFGQGGDWQTPLDAALRIHPAIYRGVGSAHPISEYTPRAAGSPRPAPVGAEVYVDGLASETLPAAGEMHLVQVTQRGLWRSQVVAEQAVADAWITEPIRVPLEVVPWGGIGLGVGTGGLVQRRGEGWPDSLGQNDYIPDDTWVALWPSVALRGGVDYGSVGLQAEVDGGLAGLVRPVGSHVQGAVLVHARPFSVGAGAGLGGSLWASGDTDASPEAEPVYQRAVEPLGYGYATGLLRTARTDAALALGAGPDVLRGTGRYAIVPTGARDALPVTVGLVGIAQVARLLQEAEAADRAVTTVTWRAGLEVGLGR